jgi:hypothetical protein
MESHQDKKRSMMRSLKVATNYQTNGNLAESPMMNGSNAKSTKRRYNSKRAGRDRSRVGMGVSQSGENNGRFAALRSRR